MLHCGRGVHASWMLPAYAKPMYISKMERERVMLLSSILESINLGSAPLPPSPAAIRIRPAHAGLVGLLGCSGPCSRSQRILSLHSWCQRRTHGVFGRAPFHPTCSTAVEPTDGVRQPRELILQEHCVCLPSPCMCRWFEPRAGFSVLSSDKFSMGARKGLVLRAVKPAPGSGHNKRYHMDFSIWPRPAHRPMCQ
jgi:hypothetical protein